MKITKVLLTVFLCALLFTACSKEKEKVTNSANSDGTRDSYVYTYNSIEFHEPGYEYQLHNVVHQDDCYYIFAERFQLEPISSSKILYCMDKDGNIVAEHDLGLGFALQSGVVIEDGKIYYPAFSNRLEIYDIESETSTTSVLCDDRILGVYKASDGYVILALGAAYKYDNDWNLLYSVENSDWDGYVGANNYYEKDGHCYIYAGMFNKRYYEIDFENETSSLIYDPCADGQYMLYQCSKDYFFDNEGLFKLDFVNGTSVPLTSWNCMDLMPSKYWGGDSHYFAVNDDEFINVYNYENGIAQVIIYTYDPSLDYSDRTQLTLGGFNCRDDFTLNWAVFMYNTSQDEYRIVIEEYNDRFTWATTDEAVTAQLEMTQYFNEGHTPDIFYGNYFDYDSLAESGDVINMYPYLMDVVGEEGLSRLSDSVRNLMISDETCYQVFSSYILESYLGDVEVLGNNTEYTIDDVLALTPGPDKIMFANMISSYLASDAIVYAVTDDGFSTEELSKIVNYSLEYGIIDFYNYSNMTMVWDEEEDAILHRYQINSPMFWSDDESRFGCELITVGLPSLYGSSHLVTPFGRMAISSVSSHPEACCEFISLVWDYEVQESCATNWFIPVNDECLRNSAYYATDFDLIPEDDYYFLNWVNFYDEISVDSAERYLAAVYNADTLLKYDWGLMKIIEDEVNAYYSQNKAVDAIVESIHSRLSVYLAE